MTVYVCSDKDIECGDRPEGWCLGCPKRGLLQVAVAPHAAAHGGPTVMRPATPEEHRWLRDAVRRSSTIVRPRRATDEEVNEWAKRHGLNVWDRPSEARAAFEDAETHHMTRSAGVPGSEQEGGDR